MDFKIISDIENKLFNRREIEGEVHSDAAPNREEVARVISESMKIPEENLKIKTIQAKFGSQVFVVVANVYNSSLDKENVERKSKKEKELEEKRKKMQEEAEKPIEEETKESDSETQPIPEQQDGEDKNLKENKVEEEKNE
jgi:ribosomal protein S24E